MMHEYCNPRITLHYVDYNKERVLRETSTCKKLCIERIHHKDNASVEFEFKECYQYGYMGYWSVIDNGRIIIDTTFDPSRTNISIYCKSKSITQH